MRIYILFLKDQYVTFKGLYWHEMECLKNTCVHYVISIYICTKNGPTCKEVAMLYHHVFMH